MNLYGFASGDPINFSDPFGTCPVVALAGGPIIGGGTGLWCLAELALLGTAATSATSTSAQGRHADWPYQPRPKFRQGPSDDVEAALTPGAADNTYVCPTCGGTFPVRNPDGSRGYDKDHIQKWAERLLDLKEAEADRAKVREEYQKDLRGRCPSCNRGDNKPPEKKEDPKP